MSTLQELISIGVLVIAPVAAAEIPVPVPETSADDDAVEEHQPGSERDAFAAALLGRLHLANIQEMTTGKQGEKKGQSREVRECGAQLVRDHAAVDKRVMAFAKLRKLDISVTGHSITEPEHASNRSFDDRFLASALEVEKKTIADVESGRRESTDDALNALLDSILPVLDQDRDLAQKLIDDRSRR